MVTSNLYRLSSQNHDTLVHQVDATIILSLNEVAGAIILCYDATKTIKLVQNLVWLTYGEFKVQALNLVKKTTCVCFLKKRKESGTLTKYSANNYNSKSRETWSEADQLHKTWQLVSLLGLN